MKMKKENQIVPPSSIDYKNSLIIHKLLIKQSIDFARAEVRQIV